MPTVFNDNERVTIPPWVTDLNSFRQWLHSSEFPEGGRISFLLGEVWVDMSKEQVFSHNQIKGEYSRVLGNLAKGSRRGRFIPDGMLLTLPEVDFSTQPDGAFVSRETLASGRVQLKKGAQEGFVELLGVPDMVLEIISPSSEEKDRDTLRELYWRAGIDEYWLVDVRGDRLEFDIFRFAAKGYVPARKQSGWIKSHVFGESFQLQRENDDLGHPEFTLNVR